MHCNSSDPSPECNYKKGVDIFWDRTCKSPFVLRTTETRMLYQSETLYFVASCASRIRGLANGEIFRMYHFRRHCALNAVAANISTHFPAGTHKILRGTEELGLSTPINLPLLDRGWVIDERGRAEELPLVAPFQSIVAGSSLWKTARTTRSHLEAWKLKAWALVAPTRSKSSPRNNS